MSAPVGELLDLGIAELGLGFRQKHWSPVETVQASLARIEATQPVLHAWVTIDAERAVAAAIQAEREIMAGRDRGPLLGVPVGIKDIFDVAGLPTHCGSRSLDDALPAATSARTVERLQSAGAIVLGKTVTQEFAAGTISAPARNPWDPARIPGGSSGGSAVAVASGACFAAMGSDTGGSIRIPAAACGVTGLKPTFGALDLFGIYPLSWSLDTAGPIARTVDDTWLMWQALSGAVVGPKELITQTEPAPRIGVSRPYFCDWLQPGVAAAFEAAIAELAASGMTLVESPWPDAATAQASAFLINRVETAAVHERVAIAEPVRFARYGGELRLRIAAGRAISATTYTRAVQARELVKKSMANLFAKHDLDALVAPTLPTTALLADRLAIEGTGRDESVGAGWTRLTMPFNATGQPVVALPCGFDSGGLPVGLQLAGRPGEESRLFQVARALEHVLGVHKLRPRFIDST